MNMLTDAGIRPSAQRLAVLEYIYSCDSHPTADDVYASLLEVHPMLSRTTVFSCLKLFAEKGLINDINISPDSTRYDSFRKLQHAHFLCRVCHRIIDIPLDISSLDFPIEFACDSVNVFFKGYCPDCEVKKSTNI